MSNNIQNIKKAVGSTVLAATSTVAVSTEVLADSTNLISGSIKATPAVLKALLVAPFSAAKGYLMEAEGLSAEDAEAVAFHYMEQDAATTIIKASEGAGKLMATMFAEEDEGSITTAEKQQEVDNQ